MTARMVRVASGPSTRSDRSSRWKRSARASASPGPEAWDREVVLHLGRGRVELVPCDALVAQTQHHPRDTHATNHM